MNFILIRLLAASLGIATLFSFQTTDLNSSDIAKAERISDTVTTSEWLGPLAPIAISPFFGITCLAGMSQISKGTFLENNHFISSNSVLQNPYIFWAFLVLTLMTSLPRFTKVSKPVAQALDQVETYAGIITLLIIRIAAAYPTAQDPETTLVLQMGFFTFTSELLLCVVAVLNIIVINTVKFFFEILVWLTPAPSVDALLEATNKAVCACLMAIYAYSPAAAAFINVMLFCVCLFIFRWVHRRVVYARHVLLDPILTFLIPAYSKLTHLQLQVFNQRNLGPFAAKSKLYLETNADGWRLTQRRFFTADKSISIPRSKQLIITPGLLTHRITIPGESNSHLVFTRRYTDQLDTIVNQMHLHQKDGDQKTPILGLDSL